MKIKKCSVLRGLEKKCGREGWEGKRMVDLQRIEYFFSYLCRAIIKANYFFSIHVKLIAQNLFCFLCDFWAVFFYFIFVAFLPTLN